MTPAEMTPARAGLRMRDLAPPGYLSRGTLTREGEVSVPSSAQGGASCACVVCELALHGAPFFAAPFLVPQTILFRQGVSFGHLCCIIH